MGSLAGAFVASILIGVLQTFAVALDYSMMSFLNWAGASIGPDTPGYSLMKVTIAQSAAILPFLLLVLILIFRPKGLMGTRE
jgi:branched-chain amino acid transport system permease protein